MIPLQLLHAGATAEIVAVAGHDEQVRRMREIGMREGTKIDMVRGGSPCIVRLGNQTLCIRTNEQLHVLVRAEGDA
ncbi:MAG: FeoA family protein [Pirellulales bacterium]